MGVLSGRTIVLLEDEYLIALDAQGILADMGADVFIATTLPEAEKLAEMENVDLALLDVNINGQFSFPVAQKFHDRQIPIVFASGYELKARAFPGADLGGCIAKPYTPERLRKAVVGALSSNAAGDGPDGQAV
jgi:DNA-binding response OmpR family regulator